MPGCCFIVCVPEFEILQRLMYSSQEKPLANIMWIKLIDLIPGINSNSLHKLIHAFISQLI